MNTNYGVFIGTFHTMKKPLIKYRKWVSKCPCHDWNSQFLLSTFSTSSSMKSPSLFKISIRRSFTLENKRLCLSQHLLVNTWSAREMNDPNEHENIFKIYCLFCSFLWPNNTAEVIPYWQYIQKCKLYGKQGNKPV